MPGSQRHSAVHIALELWALPSVCDAERKPGTQNSETRSWYVLLQAYVLNDRQRPLPVGVPGRLHISGACLARGILRNPQQTAERFIANPFFDPFADPLALSRMVDTGILALWRPDGSLEFAGFANRQVSIVCLWPQPLVVLCGS